MTTDWLLLKCSVVHANAACETAQPRAGTTRGSRQECSAVRSGQLLLSSDKRHHVSRCQFPKSQQHCREPTKDTPSLAGGTGGSQPAARPVTLRTTRHDRVEWGQRGTTAGNSRGCSARPAPSAAAEANLSGNSIYQHQVLPTCPLTCRGPQLMVSRTCQCRISETCVAPRARGRPLRHTNLMNSC